VLSLSSLTLLTSFPISSFPSLYYVLLKNTSIYFKTLLLAFLPPSSFTNIALSLNNSINPYFIFPIVSSLSYSIYICSLLASELRSSSLYFQLKGINQAQPFPSLLVFIFLS
jgi:hypothetical protein